MIKLRFLREDAENYRKEILRIWVPFLALCIAGLLGTYFFLVEPPPPRKLTIATGQATGGYHAFAQKYREFLARSGVELEIRETAGSAENIALLLDPGSGVSVAFVQSGTTPEAERDRLLGLASVYREPLFVFYRGDPPIDRLDRLAGKRLSTGAEGSGTRLIALRLLADNGITPESQAQAGAPLAALSNAEAARALAAGELDAAFFVAPLSSPPVQALIRADGVRLMGFRQHESYVRRYPYLTSVTISEGLIDLARNLPPEAVTVLAPTATLVANRSLHPALISLLLEGAEHAHRSGTLLDAPGEFPTVRSLEEPISDDARRYLREGPFFLRRFLPFWPASLVDRLKFMLLPLATVLFSIVKIVQPIYDWRIRRRVYQHYALLRDVDRKARQELDPARRDEAIAALRRLETEISQVSVPLSSMDELYRLYQHVSHVRRELEALERKPAP